MRETNFIKQNKEKWLEFEGILNTNKKDPEKMSKLFVQITDDLSYSRTFYPNRSVRVYLNNLAQKVFNTLYKTKKTNSGSFMKFWTDELPMLVWNSRRAFLVSFLVFVLAFAIGMISSAMDSDFPRIILGDRYVDMTLENINSGDPMKVYKEMNQMDMFMGITLNNLWVGFLTFIFGIVFGIGTIGVLIQNAVMIGSFQYFFHEQGVLRESLLTVWVHGTLEISAIIIAGAAGLVLGRGLIFPGTYSRLQAFQLSARKGVKLMLGIVPVIIMAGFIEGFVTRLTDLPDFVRGGIICVSLLFILFYFAYYPSYKAKGFISPLAPIIALIAASALIPLGAEVLPIQIILLVVVISYPLALVLFRYVFKFKLGFVSKLETAQLSARSNEPIRLDKIKTSGEVFKDTFDVYRKHFIPFLVGALAMSSIYVSAIYFIDPENINNYVSFRSTNTLFQFIPNPFTHFQNMLQYFDYSNFQWFYVLNFVSFGGMALIVYYHFIRGLKEDHHQVKSESLLAFAFKGGNIIKILVVTGLIFGLFFMHPGLAFLATILLVPVLIFWQYGMVKENSGLFTALGNSFSILKYGFGHIIGLYLIISLVTLLFSFALGSPLLIYFFELFKWNLNLSDLQADNMILILLTFVTIFSFCLMFPLYLIATGLLYESLKEIKTATNLKDKIWKLGDRRWLKGMETEA